MNTKLLYLAAGLATGAGVSYYVTKKYYTDLMDKTIQEVTEDYKSRFDTAFGTVMNEPTFEPNESTTPEAKPSTEKSLGKRNNGVERVNYAAISSGKDEENYIEDEEPSLPITVKTVPPKGKKIYCIAPEEFIELNGNEKVTLTYFEEDKVFMNELDQVEHNGLKLIGASNLKKIGDYEDGTLYVRNDSNGTDYEVIFESGSYEEYCERG